MTIAGDGQLGTATVTVDAHTAATIGGSGDGFTVETSGNSWAVFFAAAADASLIGNLLESTGLGRRLADRYLTLFGAFAPHDGEAAAEVEVAGSEPTQLGDAQAAPVQQLDDGLVTQGDRLVVACGRGEQGVQVGSPQHGGQASVAVGRR